MKTKPIIAGAVGIAVVFCITIFFVVARPSPSPITVRYIKSVRSNNSVMLTFEITNHIAGICMALPVSVEVRKGARWSRVFDLDPPPIPPTPWTPPLSYFLRQHEFSFFTLEVTNLPTAYPVRLRLRAHRERGQLEGLLVRFRLRAFEGQKDVSVNPFDRSTSIFGKGTQILSDEFVEPEPNQLGQGNSAQ